MTELIIQTGKHQGKKIDLAGTDCIIGRHESCKIRIASTDVSKQHCRLKHKQGQLFAKDLGSRNGTFLNEEQIQQEVPLKEGDILRVGPMAFLVSHAPADPSSQPNAAKVKPTEEQLEGDDLIAAWLSEGGDLEKSGQDSTVVIPSSGAAQKPPEKSKAEAKTVATPEEAAMKSIREQAQAIIQRWQADHDKG